MNENNLLFERKVAMERIREEEKDKLMYILKNCNEDDPSYIEAKARVEYEIKCLKEEAEDRLKKEVIKAEKILAVSDDDFRNYIKNSILYSKKVKGDDWLAYFENNNEKLGKAMAIAYEKLYGEV